MIESQSDFDLIHNGCTKAHIHRKLSVPAIRRIKLELPYQNRGRISETSRFASLAIIGSTKETLFASRANFLA